MGHEQSAYISPFPVPKYVSRLHEMYRWAIADSEMCQNAVLDGFVILLVSAPNVRNKVYGFETVFIASTLTMASPDHE